MKTKKIPEKIFMENVLLYVLFLQILSHVTNGIDDAYENELPECDGRAYASISGTSRTPWEPLEKDLQTLFDPIQRI